MVEPSAENYTRYRKITDRIDAALQRVSDDTSLHSSRTPILNHPEFNFLIGEGDRIIPYLFHRITHSGCNWVILLLLARLASENPVPHEHRGHFYWNVLAWLGWYLGSVYYERDDIYHGLIEEDNVEVPSSY